MIECRDALARGIIVPVAVDRFEQFAPPADLRQINWFDLVDWTGEDDHEDWGRTLQNLGKLVGRKISAPARTNSQSANSALNEAPAADPAIQARADLLGDLRTTWNAFPDKSDLPAVERFLGHVRDVVADSGFEFEIEHHIEGLVRDAERRAEKAERAAAELRSLQAEETKARQLAQETRRKPGAIWRDAIPGMPADTVPEMVTIPSADRDPSQDGRDDAGLEVKIEYCFALGKYPVTFADLEAAIAVGANLEWPTDHGLGRDRHPAINVNWHDAKAYIAWLNGRLGLTDRDDAYRLPSELEWEYASNAGASVTADYKDKEEAEQGMLKPVGSRAANVFGLHCMDGTLLEWCEDHWSDEAAEPGRAADGTPWLAGDPGARVLRGGSWKTRTPEIDLTSRVSFDAASRRDDIGFRLARTISLK